MYLIEEWITWLRVSRTKGNTILAYARDVRHIGRALDKVALDTATEDQFRSAFKILSLEGLSPTSLKRMHSGIRKFLCFLEERHYAHGTESRADLLEASIVPPHMIGKKEKRGEAPRTYVARKYEMLADPAYLRERYLTLRMGTEEIATEVGCTKQAVFKALRAHGIETRNHSQAWRAAAEKENTMIVAIPVNEDFFSGWSPAAAYVLGVIFTDGTLYHSKASDGSERLGSGRVTISQKETELLVKVAALIGHSGKMTFQPRRECRGQVAGELYTLAFSSDRMVADLVRLGLRPRKSASLQFPNIPEDMNRHFIRGCWDGDGSAFIDKQAQKIRASFISGSLNFVEGMIECLKNAGLPEKRIYIHKGKNLSYYFQVTGTQVPKLYHYLYDDVPELQYLDRKYKLFRASLREKTETLHVLSFIVD